MFIRYIKGTIKNSNKHIKQPIVLKETIFKTKHYIATYQTTNKKILINAHLTSKKKHNTILLKNSFNNKLSYVSTQLTAEHKDKMLFLKVEQGLDLIKTEKVNDEISELLQTKVDKFQVVFLYEGLSIPLEDFSEKILFSKKTQDDDIFSEHEEHSDL